MAQMLVLLQCLIIGREHCLYYGSFDKFVTEEKFRCTCFSHVLIGKKSCNKDILPAKC